MDKYCCFLCPKEDYADKSLQDTCPTCKRKYGFPLFDCPRQIDRYRVVEALDRGFYAATFLVESGALNIRSVLKVSPVALYTFFRNKDFEGECRTHLRVSQGTEHIVGIRNMFDADVAFGSTTILCHVAELEHVEGDTLAHHLHQDGDLSASTVAQIAIDLFGIAEALRNKRVNHNDLHDRNIIVERLQPDSARAGAIDGSIRAVAIDLGSVSDGSKSDDQSRLGDLHWIAAHLNGLIGRLLRDPDGTSDLDNRLANVLDVIIQRISPPIVHQRTSPSEFIDDIEEAYHRVASPWRPWDEPLILPTFGASYNAQSMRPWHVPHLLVDPNDQWLNRICSPGPQVITGMRGCGKTMLLQALQLHARAAQRKADTKATIVERLKEDNYVGLFVSAQRLVQRPGAPKATIENPFSRLFVAYGLEAVRSLQHLFSVYPDSESPNAYRDVAIAISDCVTNDYDLTAATSGEDLESRLTRLLLVLSQADHNYPLTVHPNVAFPTMADALRRSVSIWRNAQILFLLDDVSTRNLEDKRIEELLSALLFQHPSCAFKLTSEAQTIELRLKSPAELHPARVGRDLTVFDLGAKVYEKIKKNGKGNGKDFVEAILQQRAEHFAGHQTATPRELLGDVPLEKIAYEIGSSATTSGIRRKVYRGLTALSRMCVGDIGDVISLYEQIISVRQNGPIPAALQSECFQDFCALRLYDLNRRDSRLRDVAKSFAEASHQLLLASCKTLPSAVKSRRIRQYSSLYVRITTGDPQHQIAQLRELIDAGVFVFAGGSSVPRTKTRDSNPMQQFKLTYRKVYGLVNFIGLGERDRFELSGNDLENWLNDPSDGSAILLRNRASYSTEDTHIDPAESSSVPVTALQHPVLSVDQADGVERDGQIFLFDTREPAPTRLVHEDPGVRISPVLLNDRDPLRGPSVEIVDDQSISDTPIDRLVLGLGFEQRTLESVKRICESSDIQSVLGVRYSEYGKSKEIKSALMAVGAEVVEVPYSEVLSNGLGLIPGNVLVDITGLAKPAIFFSVRSALIERREVLVCHTEAEHYYPLDSDLETLFGERDSHQMLDALSGILTGEEGPYECVRLLPDHADDTRQRALCAFSSAKHERLLSLFDNREYDRVELVAPGSGSYRSRVAHIAAQVAARNNPNSGVTEIDSNDLSSVLSFLVRQYGWWCLENGMNFELGLTGSKLQAVAAAAVSADFKVSQCWYVRPKRFDSERFTGGVGQTRLYRIRLRSH